MESLPWRGTAARGGGLQLPMEACPSRHAPARHLGRLARSLRRAPRLRPLDPLLVDGCAWWLPRLRRRPPFGRALAWYLECLLRRRLGPLAPGEVSAPFWGHLFALRFRRCARRPRWRLEIW